jgi:leucyl aminopeptidase
MAKAQGLAVKVWDEAAIKKGKLGGLLGVNRGSTNPPRLVELTYTPKGTAKGFLALVGKGITFDAGGLSIKTGQGMMTMKCDMGGAAAVVGVMSVLNDLQVPCKVRAWIPMTDNMLGGDATRPGDVLRIRNGKTIEVLNTDAEGRLILADGLSLASEAKPDAIVDLATLTGACMVALGPKIAGLMSNNDAWVEQIEAASFSSGERVWHLPLPGDYMKMCDSAIADMKNIGGPHGGALTAGLILQQFVGDGIPWAHLDIAGPAFTDVEDGEWSKGGTGFGVRLLADLASNFQKPS